MSSRDQKKTQSLPLSSVFVSEIKSFSLLRLKDPATWPGPQHSRHHHACFVDGLMVHPQGPETCKTESSSPGLGRASLVRSRPGACAQVHGTNPNLSTPSGPSSGFGLQMLHGGQGHNSGRERLGPVFLGALFWSGRHAKVGHRRSESGE